MGQSSENKYMFSVVIVWLLLAFFLADIARENVEAKSSPVAFASRSRRVMADSTIQGYVRAEKQSDSARDPTTKRKTSTRKKLKIWALGFFLGAVVGIITGFLLSVLYKVIKLLRGRSKRIVPTIFSPMIKNPEHLSFLSNEDEVKALEVVGEGACGIVYKAPPQSGDGKILAVKKIEIPATDSSENSHKNLIQMRSELEMVGRVRHKNIVPLLAHVEGNGCHYLIYEFMKNGSLQVALKDAALGHRELAWPVRKNIAVGISLGLEYIHSQQRPRILHRDLKPANILLDEDMEARIADFGLAKLIADGLTHVTASHLGGTPGYMDPNARLRITEKCDIYSFGMIIGALVTGKEPNDPFFQDTMEFTMVKWVRSTVNSENPSEAIDPKLRGNGFEEEILRVLKVAYLCTLDDAKERPDAIKAKEMLSHL